MQCSEKVWVHIRQIFSHTIILLINTFSVVGVHFFHSYLRYTFCSLVQWRANKLIKIVKNEFPIKVSQKFQKIWKINTKLCTFHTFRTYKLKPLGPSYEHCSEFRKPKKTSKTLWDLNKELIEFAYQMKTLAIVLYVLYDILFNMNCLAPVINLVQATTNSHILEIFTTFSILHYFN